MVWTRQVAVVLAVLHFCTACYTYVPVVTAPAPGARVAIDINDDGRVALRDQLGPAVVRVEGTLTALDGDAYLVRTTSVTPIGGRPLPVDTVRVRVERRHMVRIDERQLSHSRTWIAIGTAVVIVAAFFVSGGFSGRGTPPEEPPGGPPVNQFRGR